MAQDAHKAVHVLAGSIIESVLVDYLVGTKQQKKPDPLQMGLADLIAACRKAGVLSKKTADLAGALKEYRNLIHPGRMKRLGEVVDADSALVAKSLVSMIVKEVARSQEKEFGATAEQIARKFESDPTASAITHHLLRDASPAEVERLLIDVLPERYFEEAEAAFPKSAKLDSHTKLFRAAFEIAPDSTKRKVMARHVAVLKEEPGPRVQAYEEHFFRGSDLEYVSERDRPLVKEHLLARLDDGDAAIFEVAQGIGAYLAEGDVKAFVDPLVRHGVIRSDPDAREGARRLLKAEALFTPEELDDTIAKRLESWAKAFDPEHPNIAKDVRELKVEYEIPL